MKKALSIIIFLSFTYGCKSYHSLYLESSNPIEYTFNKSLLDLRNSIKLNLTNYKGFKLISSESDSVCYVYDDTIIINSDNILLSNISYELSSALYYKHKRKLVYYASFLLRNNVGKWF